MSCAKIVCLQFFVSLCFFQAAARFAREARNESYTFDDYKLAFGRQYTWGSHEHEIRQTLFDRRVEQIRAHNAKEAPWMMGVNHLTDMTEEELSDRNGYKPVRRARPDSSGSSSLMQGDGAACGSHQSSCMASASACCNGLICGGEGKCIKVESRPESFDWTPRLNTAGSILEQGNCGSCWALAAAAALQFHAELSAQRKSRSFNRILSPQSMLSCTQNPRQCGGQGGCKGNTAELGYEWAKSRGRAGVLDIEADPYQAKVGSESRCSSSFLESSQGVSVRGWHKIQENSADAMMDSLVNVGPLVASIAANGLHMYKSGVINHNEENPDWIVNHAVVMMGYGKDKAASLDYWLLRNSWGKTWGEKGFFRVQRFAPHKDEPCGEDTDPGKGVVCLREDNTYQETQHVCGTMGILIDTAHPVGTEVGSSMLEDIDSVKGKSGLDDDEQEQLDDEEEMKNGAWCMERCQHFQFAELAAEYKHVDFGNDQDVCATGCDKVFGKE